LPARLSAAAGITRTDAASAAGYCDSVSPGNVPQHNLGGRYRELEEAADEGRLAQGHGPVASLLIA
jgi:hypothetical protein